MAEKELFQDLESLKTHIAKPLDLQSQADAFKRIKEIADKIDVENYGRNGCNR